MGFALLTPARATTGLAGNALSGFWSRLTVMLLPPQSLKSCVNCSMHADRYPYRAAIKSCHNSNLHGAPSAGCVKIMRGLNLGRRCHGRLCRAIGLGIQVGL